MTDYFDNVIYLFSFFSKINGPNFDLYDKITLYLFREVTKWFFMSPKKKYYTNDQEKLAGYAKALSNPVRIFVLDFLANNLDKCCYSGDMVENLPIARSTLSEHLKILKNAGLIQGEINPPFIKYCINRENWEEAKRMFIQFYKR